MDDCPLRDFCDAYLPKGTCLPHEHAPFGILIIDEESCCPLMSAVLCLSSDGEVLDFALSDESGVALFSPVCPGDYSVSVHDAPEGYAANPRIYTLSVSPRGVARLEGISVEFAKIALTQSKEE